MRNLEFIRADWPAPPQVRAVTTTRLGGVSSGPYASFNLGDHVGDVPDRVRANRARLGETLGLGAPPLWLRQVHGTRVVDVGQAVEGTEADGIVSAESGRACAVLTADCLPILLCDRAGTRVAALHAGWRGLAAGIVEAGVRAMRAPAPALFAWLGPGIGRTAYEVGDEVREAFAERDPGAAAAFTRSPRGRWMADMYALARRRLNAAGVVAVYGGEYCTASQEALFFSYRRDGTTGRMASLIWLG
ncbi:laccase [Sulfurifustis variabilis]|uniref:Purine nucleoside phosphorylase n=1 Tax=Sulfurifustis variabilis TaxID=1675686 RepID=A0A1B4VAM9_9GAMM|nr:peptidoglycan editing factor PgeF [Sulfurifustis variabilis]BAU48784.1 laccase [Sulfurifustis variabilis]